MTRKHSPSQRELCSFQQLEDRHLMAADLVAAAPEPAAVRIVEVQAMGHLANSMLIGPTGIAGIEPAETVEIHDMSADFVFAGPQILFDGPNQVDPERQVSTKDNPASDDKADRTESDEGSSVQDQTDQQPQPSARRAHHVIRRADGGWTDEYVDYDQNGNRIGRTFETYDRSGVLRERQTIRVDEDGNRATTTDNYDEDGKWTGSTTESFDADGRRTGGQKTQVDQDGNVQRESYNPESGEWEPVAEDDNTEAADRPGGRIARHHIQNLDGGWTDEYVDLDADGNRIGRSSETYNDRGMLRERQTTRTNADGGRTTTTQTYDDDGQWTGTTVESFDRRGNRISGERTTPDGNGGTTSQTYDPDSGEWR